VLGDGAAVEGEAADVVNAAATPGSTVSTVMVAVQAPPAITVITQKTERSRVVMVLLLS
jgi:hypothetical protein